jgi:iron complex outermembrane receptor protein
MSSGDVCLVKSFAEEASGLCRPRGGEIPSSSFTAVSDRRPHARPSAFAARLFALFGALGTGGAAAETLDPVVVTGSRVEQRAFDLPMSVDVITRGEIQDGKARVNISEDLNRVPGTFVQNRENFAQELQIVIRGFGARSQFGTRGVRLIVDGLPASTPDGQGNPGIFDLGSAERIEVLRGPFSALYGNHSGGVAQVFSESGSTPPAAGADVSFGSYGFQRYAAKGGLVAGAFDGMASASYFSTEGYREHSAALKAQFNTKAALQLDERNRLTIVATGFNQPGAQDPLGLTGAQVQANPRQAQPVALLFDARRSLDAAQGGVLWDTKLGAADALRVLAYTGSRSNEQYLAVPLDAQLAATSSGGVSTLERTSRGAGVRWTHQGALAGGALTLVAGAELDTSSEDRQGYLNRFGTRGALKRDETNDVTSTAGYVQAEWWFVPRASLTAGVRYTRVAFDSSDRYIVTGNPDDSGSVTYGEWTPSVGLLWRATEDLNLYASYGRAFETPTTAELAYRPDGASGLNFALQPAVSDQVEVGAKARLGAARVNLAVFSIRTGGEVVIARNTGGRSSFTNASDTSRLGAELLVAGEAAAGDGATLSAQAALTLLNARFDEPFRSCAPLAAFCNPVTGANTATVPAGNRIPGVPNVSFFADLQYRRPQWAGLTAAVEVVANGSVAVNDFNSAYAPGYGVANVWAGLQQRAGSWQLRQFARVNNVFERSFIGAVIVGDANGRYYAPAPTRNWLVGASATASFR